MNAQEYLAQLQSCYKRYDSLLQEAQRFGEKSFFDSALDEFMPNASPALRALFAAEFTSNGAVMPKKGWVQTVHTDFLNCLSERYQPVLDRLGEFDIAVGELPSASFNGSAIPVLGEPRSWVVALNTGVQMLMYAVARALVSSSSGDLSHEQFGEISADGAQKPLNFLYDILNAYITLGTGYSFTPYETSPDTIYYSTLIATMAERFIYAHEISHILLDHTVDTRLQALPEDWSDAKHAVHESAQENDADLVAWSLLVATWVKSHDDLKTAYLGVSLFFRIADILEHTDKLTPINTHPPASDRHAFIAAAAKLTADQLGLSLDEAIKLDNVLSTALDRSMRHKPALPTKSPFDELLELSEKGNPPDYASFKYGCSLMFSWSAPYKMCRAFGYAIAKSEKEMESLKLPPQEWDDNTLRKFNRHKLLLYFRSQCLPSDIDRYVERYRTEYAKGCNDE